MKIEFKVASENIVEFTEILTENEMESQIVGTDDDDNLLVRVHCSCNDSEVIQQLEDLSEDDQDNEE